LAQVHQNYATAAQPTRTRAQRATILETPAEERQIIPREIGIHDLLTFLGLGDCDVACETEHKLPCEEIQLNAGVSLYEQGHHVRQAFVILDGVFARQQKSNAKSAAMPGPSPIALSGERELIGLHIGLTQRPESVTAVTKATVLALSIKALQTMVPSSTVAHDLLMRTAGAALFRDWRVAYRLRDLPAFARTVAGLSHLASLAGVKPLASRADGTIALTLPLPCLSAWLDMDMEALCTQLKHLARCGVVSTSTNAIEWLDPIKLEKSWAFD
jgi:CRP-like cAMP-binding protein